MNFFQAGLSRAFRGFRERDPQLFLMGAALLAIAWLRARPVKRQLIYEKRIRPGDKVTIELDRRGDQVL